MIGYIITAIQKVCLQSPHGPEHVVLPLLKEVLLGHGGVALIERWSLWEVELAGISAVGTCSEWPNKR